jgi:hypothetical protein
MIAVTVRGEICKHRSHRLQLQFRIVQLLDPARAAPADPQVHRTPDVSDRAGSDDLAAHPLRYMRELTERPRNVGRNVSATNSMIANASSDSTSILPPPLRPPSLADPVGGSGGGDGGLLACTTCKVTVAYPD